MVVVLLLSAIVVALVAIFGVLFGILQNDRQRTANDRQGTAGAVIPNAGLLLPVRSQPAIHAQSRVLEPGVAATGPPLLTIVRIDEAIVERPNLAKVANNGWSGTVLELAGNLLSNPRFVDAVGARGGYYVVKAEPGVKWMVARGQQVAQATGKSGQAGARAVVVGGASMAIGAQFLGAVASAAAYKALFGQVVEAKFLSEVIHERQMSEVLGLVDRAAEIVKDLSRYELPERWPAVILSEAVRVGGLLLDQSAASDRLRTRMLETKGAKKVQVPEQVALEFAVSYSTHTAAAQLAAARTIHAAACGDVVTESEMLMTLERTLKRLSDHHDIMNQMVETEAWWTKLPFAPADRPRYKALVELHQPVVDTLTGSGTAWLIDGAIEGREVEARELTESEFEQLTAGSAD